MSDMLPDPIRTSFIASKFKWRTAEGVAKDARLDVAAVVRTLENSGDVVRASAPNRNGKALYALRSTYKKDEPFIQRFVAAFANAPE